MNTYNVIQPIVSGHRKGDTPVLDGQQWRYHYRAYWVSLVQVVHGILQPSSGGFRF